MAYWKVKLIGKTVIAENTVAFRFEKPAGLKFMAGQYLGISFNKLVKPDSLSIKSFSIASSPKDKFLEIATRMRNTGFKQTLASKKIGSLIDIEGPYGQFTLHTNSKRGAVFIAGGIGITTFRSIIKNALAANSKIKMMLIWSNKKPATAPYLDETQKWAQNSPNFKLITTMTQAKAGEWSGLRAKITGKFFAKHAKGAQKPVYYITGSPNFVFSVKNMLKNLKVADDDIKIEDFAGY